ncbi:hypothetical protein ACWGAN_10875 [Streptomyces sp. NPDC054945]
MSVEDLRHRADVVTVHLPKTPQDRAGVAVALAAPTALLPEPPATGAPAGA